MKITDSAQTQEIMMEAARECVLFRVRQLDRKLTQYYDGDMKESGLRGTQFAILCAAALAGPLSQHELTEILKVDQSTLSRNISVLLKDGLVNVEPGEDRRSREISISRAGREAMDKATRLWKNTHESLKAKFSEKDWQDLFRLMRKLNDAAGE